MKGRETGEIQRGRASSERAQQGDGPNSLTWGSKCRYQRSSGPGTGCGSLLRILEAVQEQQRLASSRRDGREGERADPSSCLLTFCRGHEGFDLLNRREDFGLDSSVAHDVYVLGGVVDGRRESSGRKGKRAASSDQRQTESEKGHRVAPALPPFPPGAAKVYPRLPFRASGSLILSSTHSPTFRASRRISSP